MKEQNEKQAIEEIAKVIEITEQIARDAHCGLPSPTMYAKDLYWHGYRKQSEGEWVERTKTTTNAKGMEARYTINFCSKCGYEIGAIRYQHKYCPNCGSKMKGGE